MLNRCSGKRPIIVRWVLRGENRQQIQANGRYTRADRHLWLIVTMPSARVCILKISQECAIMNNGWVVSAGRQSIMGSRKVAAVRDDWNIVTLTFAQAAILLHSRTRMARISEWHTEGLQWSSRLDSSGVTDWSGPENERYWCSKISKGSLVRTHHIVPAGVELTKRTPVIYKRGNLENRRY